jgi:hypothetical protein
MGKTESKSTDLDATAKIRSLLGQGSEYEKLDYKRTLDISDKHSVIEIAKDIGAMLSSEGGSILVGADDSGVQVPDLADAEYDKFDETKLRNALKKYIAEPINVVCSMAKVDGFNHLLIECGDYPNGFVVFKIDGQYRDAAGKDKLAFRQGEVFVRHGSASERWEQHDIDRILKAQIAKQKSAWLKDAELIMARMGNGAVPSTPENETRLKQVITDFRKRLTDNTLNLPEIENAANDVSLIALNAVVEDNEKLFKDSVAAMMTLYKAGFDHRGNWRLNSTFNPVDLWHEILLRAPIVGGFCIENKKYQWAKYLVLQKVPGDDGRHFSNWYRHALTMASRSNKFVDSKDGKKNRLLSMSADITQNDGQFKQTTNWGADEAITYCVQFDYFASMVALDDIQAIDTSAFYTSFAFFNKDLIMQLLVHLLLDEEAKKSVFKSSDEHLAFIIQKIDELASGENFFGWDKGDWPFGLRDFMKNTKELPLKG